MSLLWQDVAALLHDGAHRQPNAVVHSPDIFQFGRVLVAWMRIRPLGRRNSGGDQEKASFIPVEM